MIVAAFGNCNLRLSETAAIAVAVILWGLKNVYITTTITVANCNLKP